MSKLYTFFLGLGVILSLSFISIQSVSASEGIAELRPSNNRSNRCHVTSGKVGSNFEILVICRDLIYPNVDVPLASNYILWANPTNGSKVIKLGALGNGNKVFKSQARNPFNSLFVTAEPNTNPQEPLGNVVMRGEIRAIPFLAGSGDFQIDEENTISVTPSIESVDEVEDITEVDESENNTSTTSKILRWVGIFASIILLIALVSFVVVIAKSRR